MPVDTRNLRHTAHANRHTLHYTTDCAASGIAMPVKTDGKDKRAAVFTIAYLIITSAYLKSTQRPVLVQVGGGWLTASSHPASPQ